jgi:hypothetical protein
MSRFRNVSTALLLVLAAPAAAQGTPLVMHFDNGLDPTQWPTVGGVPGATPYFGYSDGSIPPISLGAAYSVAGGVLQQRTFGLTGQFLFVTSAVLSPGVGPAPVPTPAPLGGVWTPAKPTVVEARLRVQTLPRLPIAPGTTPSLRLSGDGVIAQARDGAAAYYFLLRPAPTPALPYRVAVLVNVANPAVAGYVDDATAFHTYRVVGRTPAPGAETVELYIDGAHVLTSVPPTHFTTGFLFGDNGLATSTGSADADWDYVMFCHGDATASVGGAANSAGVGPTAIVGGLSVCTATSFGATPTCYGATGAGPFCVAVAPGDVLMLNWTGQPGMPFALCAGVLDPRNTVFGPTAILGLGVFPGLTPFTVLYSGLAVGTPGAALFSIGPTGTAAQAFTVPTLPPGFPIMQIQGLVTQPAATGVPLALTATFDVIAG